MLIGLLLGAALSLKAQNSKTFYDNIIKNPDYEYKAPIALPNVDRADMAYLKTVVREIVLREKMNLPLYYPTVPMDGRMSLIDLMLSGIEKSFKTAYEDDELSIPVTIEQIMKKFDADADTMTRRNPETGELEKVVVEAEVRTDEVKRVLVKEVWFINRRTTRLDFRIIALCPVREYTKPNSYEGIMKSRLFWIDYGEFRDIFSKQKVFNFENDAGRLSVDDIFLKRFFTSRIIQESNVYDNRIIGSYAAGMDAILESDRIKDEIFDKEQNLWEY